MKRTTLVTGIVLSLAVATALFVEVRALPELRARNQALHHESEQSTAAIAPPHDPVPFGTSQIENDGPYRELLRLRGVVNLMRRQKDELDQLRESNRQLRSNLLSRALADEAWELSPQQIQSYLEKKGHSAESLLAALKLNGRNPDLLKEAVERYPNDPRVNLAAALAGEFRGQRRQLLDALKQSAPDNALGDYLSAHDYFKSGQTAQALQELTAAQGKPNLENYSRDSFRAAEEAYSLAGYSEAAAKAVAWSRLEMPGLNELNELRQSLGDLAKNYRQTGDEESAQAALQMGLRLGQRMADESLGIKTDYVELVGLMIQRRLLETMDPASPYDTAGQTVKDRLDELALRRAEIKKFSDPDSWDGQLLKTLPEQDLISYFERVRNSSEIDARRWAASR